MFNKVEMGNRLFVARTRKNIKQWEMGNLLGVGQSSYSDIENGKRELNTTQLFMIAEALEVPVAWILGLNDNNGLSFEDSLKVEEYIRLLRNKSK